MRASASPYDVPEFTIVNSTGDSPDTNPGDGVAWTGGYLSAPVDRAGEPEVTLRAAIQEANEIAGEHVIKFNIPQEDGGWDVMSETFVIVPGSPLPAVTDRATIAADTQPGYTGTSPVIELDGSGAGSTDVDGLLIESTAGGSKIIAMAILGFSRDGIHIDGANNVAVTSSYVGVGVSGGFAVGNGDDGSKSITARRQAQSVARSAPETLFPPTWATAFALSVRGPTAIPSKEI